MNYSYKPKDVCAKQIDFEIIDGKIHDVKFFGGCNGNLKAISKLIENKDPSEVINILEGNTCGFKKTSCADQLAKALREVLDE